MVRLKDGIELHGRAARHTSGVLPAKMVLDSVTQVAFGQLAHITLETGQLFLHWLETIGYVFYVFTEAS